MGPRVLLLLLPIALRMSLCCGISSPSVFTFPSDCLPR